MLRALTPQRDVFTDGLTESKVISYDSVQGSRRRPLAIADCNRVVELDFYAADESSATNALHKARLLREIVTEFSEAYERAIDEWRAQGVNEPARRLTSRHPYALVHSPTLPR